MKPTRYIIAVHVFIGIGCAIVSILSAGRNFTHTEALFANAMIVAASLIPMRFYRVRLVRVDSWLTNALSAAPIAK